LVATLLVWEVAGHVVFSNVAVIAGPDVTSATEAPASQVVAFEIEHAEPGYYTANLTMKIPQGVLVVKPSVKDGWNITQTYRLLPPSQWFTVTRDITQSPGIRGGPVTTVETVADTITWIPLAQSDIIQDDEIDLFEMELTLGCTYNDPATNTFWLNQYALWFPLIQFISPVPCSSTLEETTTLEWNGVGSGSDVWVSLSPAPCPYVLLQNWSGCDDLSWFGKNVPYPVAPSFITAQAATALVQTALSDFLKNINVLVNLTQPTSSPSSSSTSYDPVSIAAIVLACVAFAVAVVGFLLGLSKSKVSPRQQDVPMTQVSQPQANSDFQ